VQKEVKAGRVGDLGRESLQKEKDHPILGENELVVTLGWIFSEIYAHDLDCLWMREEDRGIN